MRNPKRTARTAASLMIGVGLVAFITIFAASAKTSVAGSLRGDYHGTHIVDSGAFDASIGLSPEFAADGPGHPRGHAWSPRNGSPTSRSTGATTPSSRRFDAADDRRAVRPRHRRRRHRSARRRRHRRRSDRRRRRRPQLGDTREVTFSTGTKTFVVRAIYDNSAEWVGDRVRRPRRVRRQPAPARLDSRLYVATDDEAALGAGRRPVPDRGRHGQGASSSSPRTPRSTRCSSSSTPCSDWPCSSHCSASPTRWRCRSTSANGNSGLLRAVGMSRAQVRSSVRWESVIIALFGTALGLGIGVFFGWAMMQALSDAGRRHAHHPGTATGGDHRHRRPRRCRCCGHAGPARGPDRRAQGRRQHLTEDHQRRRGPA